jgi:type IV pilus assembly protein PilN
VRLSINLASEPFRRDRHVVVGLGALSALLVCTLAILVYLAVSARDRAAVIRGEVERLNDQARLLANDQAKYEGTLRQPANSEVLERSVLLNTLLERKAISWTRLFADLEKVLPENVRLISIRMPRASGPGQVTLDMTVGSKSPEPVLSLLRHLAASPDFGPASVSTSIAPTENEPLYRYRVSVNYAQKL